MGEGDILPGGRHARRRDPNYVKKILEGGKKADEIRKKALEHHKKEEEPLAEEQLLKDLKKI
jgi:hypothetical protein